MVMLFLATRRPAAVRYRRGRLLVVAAVLFCGIYYLLLLRSNRKQIPEADGYRLPPGPVSVSNNSKNMVVASMRAEDTSWLFEYFPDWHKSVYVVDDENAELTVKKNKGRESMVYLTYIIDNYDNLPEFMLFIHAQRYQWHNDDPYYDGVPMLENFQLPYLSRQGYVNLRCVWILGCPDEIHPFMDGHRNDVHAEEYFMKAFKELFPGKEVPAAVGVSCCAQFGLARWKAKKLPKSEYERIRQWLLDTALPDELSGRIMEYSWHMFFGNGPIHCPTAASCYCNVFGLCDLTCETDAGCRNRYVLPRYSTLPVGWPYIGWNGQPQDPSQGGLPIIV